MAAGGRAQSCYNPHMRILLTNDDGILAPGIEALYSAVADLGQVDVVAPADPQSAIGHAITVLTPLTVRSVRVNDTFDGWSVSGRPADCVKLALVELLDEPPDLVLSGINAGANTGVNVLYSGTVAAAREGALFGIPSIAFSLERSEQLDFAAAGRVARQIVERCLSAGLAPGRCLTVNIPALDQGMPIGVRCCRQAPINWEEHYDALTDEQGHRVFRLDGREPEHHGADDCDIHAVRERYVSITPLRADMTDDEELTQITTWDWPRGF